jgi:hypothetical protein
MARVATVIVFTSLLWTLASATECGKGAGANAGENDETSLLQVKQAVNSGINRSVRAGFDQNRGDDDDDGLSGRDLLPSGGIFGDSGDSSSHSPMANSNFRSCLKASALLEDGNAGYAFFKASASSHKAPFVEDKPVSMMTCVEMGLCDKPSPDLTHGSMFKSEWSTAEIVETCFADYRSAADATLYTLGNVHKGVQFVPFLGNIMALVRSNAAEATKRGGKEALAKREEVAVAGSTFDLKQGILKDVNDCLEQLEMERMNLLLTDMNEDVPRSLEKDGSDLLPQGLGSYCEDIHGI